MPVKDLDLWVTIPTGIPTDQPTSTHRFMILMPTLNLNHDEGSYPYIKAVLNIVADGLDVGIETADDFLRTLKLGVHPGGWNKLYA